MCTMPHCWGGFPGLAEAKRVYFPCPPSTHADTLRDRVHIHGVDPRQLGPSLPWVSLPGYAPSIVVQVGSVYACCLCPSLSCASRGGPRQSSPALPGQSG